MECGCGGAISIFEARSVGILRFSMPRGEKRNCECVMGILPIEEHVFLHLTEELYSSEMFRCFADSDSGVSEASYSS